MDVMHVGEQPGEPLWRKRQVVAQCCKDPAPGGSAVKSSGSSLRSAPLLLLLESNHGFGVKKGVLGTAIPVEPNAVQIRLDGTGPSRTRLISLPLNSYQIIRSWIRRDDPQVVRGDRRPHVRDGMGQDVSASDLCGDDHDGDTWRIVSTSWSSIDIFAQPRHGPRIKRPHLLPKHRKQ
jgi:hypothetical protein